MFFSFHYRNDHWRASQIRNLGIIDGNRAASDNDWEQVKRGGDQAIRRWINSQMEGKSTVIVLIGSETAGRKWINYEIETGWKLGKSLLGIYIHQLKNQNGLTSTKGNNPFAGYKIGAEPLQEIVPILDAGNCNSQTAYSIISRQIGDYIELAKSTRSKF